MRCPYCGTQDKDHVLDSRPAREGAAIKRRRECDACRGRFTTFEEIEEMRLMVVKGGDRGREPYRREKLRRAIELACKKRPVTDAQIEATVDEIERKLYSRQEKEVPSSEIGEMVMDRLRHLDQVAYIRFASVYRQFEDVRQFRLLVDKIGARRPAKRSAATSETAPDDASDAAS